MPISFSSLVTAKVWFYHTLFFSCLTVEFDRNWPFFYAWVYLIDSDGLTSKQGGFPGTTGLLLGEIITK